jgi:hypothetical protein
MLVPRSTTPLEVAMRTGPPFLAMVDSFKTARPPTAQKAMAPAVSPFVAWGSTEQPAGNAVPGDAPWLAWCHRHFERAGQLAPSELAMRPCSVITTPVLTMHDRRG